MMTELEPASFEGFLFFAIFMAAQIMWLFVVCRRAPKLANGRLVDSTNSLTGNNKISVVANRVFNMEPGSETPIDHALSDVDYQLVERSVPIPIPKDVYSYYKAATRKVAYGCLPEIRRFYCICDNWLFMWPVDSGCVSEKMKEMGDVIKVVAVVGLDPNVFPKGKDQALVIATPTYLKIIPINGNVRDPLGEGSFYTVDLPSVPLCVVGGKDGMIFVSTGNNCLLVVGYKQWKYVITSTSRWNGRMTQLCVHYNGDTIAAVDDQKRKIRLFEYDRRWGIVWNTWSCSVANDVSSICPGEMTRVATENTFMVFFADGSQARINDASYLRASSRSWLVLKYFSFLLRSNASICDIDTYGNAQQAELHVKSAISAIGLTALLHDKEITLLRKDGRAAPKRVIEKLKGTGLCIGMAPVDRSCANPQVWQHYMAPPLFYVLTSDGGFVLSFLRPCEELSHLVINGRGSFTTDVEMWLTGRLQESVASILLCSSLFPTLEKSLVHIATRFMSVNIEREIEDVPVTLYGFYARVAYLLRGLSDVPIVERTDDENRKGEFKYRVSKVFLTQPRWIISQLQGVQKAIQQYASDRKVVTTVNSRVHKSEVDLMRRTDDLNAFIKFMITQMKMIGSIGQEKSKKITSLFESRLSGTSADRKKASCVIERLVAFPFFSLETSCEVDLETALYEVHSEWFCFLYEDY